MGGIKQAFQPQLFLELLEGNMQISYPVRRQRAAVELIGAVPRKNRDASKRQHPHAVLRPEPQRARIALKQDAAQGCAGILQGEIMMPRGIDLVIRDLTAYAKALQRRIGVKHLLYVGVDLADFQDFTLHGAPPR